MQEAQRAILTFTGTAATDTASARTATSANNRAIVIEIRAQSYGCQTFSLSSLKWSKISLSKKPISVKEVFFVYENLRSSVPPPIVRSELGGSWRRLSEKQKFLGN